MWDRQGLGRGGWGRIGSGCAEWGGIGRDRLGSGVVGWGRIGWQRFGISSGTGRTAKHNVPQGSCDGTRVQSSDDERNSGSGIKGIHESNLTRWAN